MIEPGERVDLQLFTSFPEPHAPGGVRDAFSVAGDYLDRSMQNEYPIITSWLDDDDA